MKSIKPVKLVGLERIPIPVLRNVFQAGIGWNPAKSNNLCISQFTSFNQQITGNPSFFQPITRLELGNTYSIQTVARIRTQHRGTNVVVKADDVFSSFRSLTIINRPVNPMMRSDGSFLSIQTNPHRRSFSTHSIDCPQAIKHQNIQNSNISAVSARVDLEIPFKIHGLQRGDCHHPKYSNFPQIQFSKFSKHKILRYVDLLSTSLMVTKHILCRRKGGVNHKNPW